MIHEAKLLLGRRLGLRGLGQSCEPHRNQNKRVEALDELHDVGSLGGGRVDGDNLVSDSQRSLLIRQALGHDSRDNATPIDEQA